MNADQRCDQAAAETSGNLHAGATGDPGVVRSGAYDDKFQGQSVRDMGNNVWRYEYDDRGRLTVAVAPGNEIDLTARYDGPDGKVSETLIAGVLREYAYNHQLADNPALTATQVLVDGQRVTVFGQNADGITVYSKNAVGTESQLTLNDKNLPAALSRCGTQTHKFDYRSNGKLRRTTRYSDDDEEVFEFSYEKGHLSAISDEYGNTRWTVTRRDDGRQIEVSGPDAISRVRYDQSGNLRALVDGDRALLLRPNSRGLIDSITDGHTATIELQYYSTGALKRVMFPEGKALEFTYDDLGLRREAQLPNGTLEKYFYSPAGSLRRLEKHARDGDVSIAVFKLDEYSRQKQLTIGDAVYDFVYDGYDQLTKLNGSDLRLVFGYDDLGRFESVSAGGVSEKWRYEYDDGEPDLREQMDSKTRTRLSGRIDASQFGPALEIIYNRMTPSRYGPVNLDLSLGEFTVTGIAGTVLPTSMPASALARGRLDTALQSLNSESEFYGEGLFAFNSPSNVYFIPNEFWSVNCGYVPPKPCKTPVRGGPNPQCGGVGGGPQCAGSVLRAEADRWLASFPTENRERGASIICSAQNGQSVANAGNFTFSGSDRCVSPITTTGTGVKAIAHSHPVFIDDDVGLVCRGEVLTEETIVPQNRANRRCGDGDTHLIPNRLRNSLNALLTCGPSF